MKKAIAVFLTIIFVYICAVPAFSDSDTGSADTFVPVIRFVASSDTHIVSSNDVNRDRIIKMFNLAYDVAESDSNYSSLDAVLIAGDLTNDGTRDEFDKFGKAISDSVRGDTKFLGVVAKNHDGYEMKRQELRDYYKQVTGNDADFHVVINGYHFFGISASDKDGIHYSTEQLNWLDKELAQVTKAEPDKPVFIINHEHVRNTVYGSSAYDGWGITTFKSIFNKYPQVVSFTGHSHYPLNDPRSVWQGKFTAVGTGAITYSEFTIDESRAYHPSDCSDTATCWIVELDAQNNMRLRGYDVNESVLLCERFLENPADNKNREYTPAKRKAASSAPAFAEGSAIEVNPEEGACTVTVPVAQSTDGEPVILYRAFAKNKLGMTVAQSWTLPQYYRAIDFDTVELKLSDLPGGDYTISVVAENAYEMQSDPLTAEVSIDGETGFAGLLTLISGLFERIKAFFVRLFW